MSKTLGVLLVVALVVIAILLLGPRLAAQEPPECAQWAVRAIPLGDIGEAPPAEQLTEAGWEPFAGSVRQEPRTGQIGRVWVRPYVFLRRCVTWSS